MKKILSILLLFLLLFSFTACGSEKSISQKSNEETTGTYAQKNIEDTADDFPKEEDISDPGQTSELESAGENQTAGNILIVYFSRWGNTDYPADVDATTSASIVVDKDVRYGTTEYIANMIADETGGILHRIETVVPYTTDFDELRDVNHDEMDQDYLPELKESNLDISGYDTVFVGYPVWASGVPQAVLSFFDEYDMTGKTVIPFCTHDGYGAGRSYQVIADASHAAVSLEGIAIEAKDVPDAFSIIADWLENIGIYFENGDITYCEAHHNMAIFYAQTDNPNLSVDVIPIGRVTSGLSVFENLESREEIVFSLVQ